MDPPMLQSSLSKRAVASLKILSRGLGRMPGTPKSVRAGPEARTSTSFAVVPLMAKPAIRVRAPLPARARVETLARRSTPSGAPGAANETAAPPVGWNVPVRAAPLTPRFPE